MMTALLESKFNGKWQVFVQALSPGKSFALKDVVNLLMFFGSIYFNRPHDFIF